MLKDPAKNDVATSSIEGKTVALYFSASWCVASYYTGEKRMCQFGRSFCDRDSVTACFGARPCG